MRASEGLTGWDGMVVLDWADWGAGGQCDLAAASQAGWAGWAGQSIPPSPEATIQIEDKREVAQPRQAQPRRLQPGK